MKSTIFDNKTVFITGGTGSFGKAITKRLLNETKVAKIVIYSRDEMKQWQMETDINDRRMRFFLGDVRDKPRLKRALAGCDYVVHAAAMKIVPSAEYNPFECIKTNVIGAMNLIDCCLDLNISKIVALSTDKACSPINLYGATKLTSDKLFVSANNYVGGGDTSFSVVRYGNVIGSRGSIIPFLRDLSPESEIPLTHNDMTRFFITLDQGIDLVLNAFETAVGGEIFVKKIPSILIRDLIDALFPNRAVKIIGIRPGEKIHEAMISADDARTTYEYEDHYKILPHINDWHIDQNRIAGGVRVQDDFSYTSENNPNFLTVDEIKNLITFS